MVAYHTPKVYRSPFGCCICRAKSSSSRFTDSSRYENDFVACFKLEEHRYGEICNACVLLIKRWKKLPVGTKRNWHHVVDARARPRGRGVARSENAQNANIDSSSTIDKLSRLKITKHKYVRKKIRAQSPDDSEDHYVDDVFSEASGASVPSSRAPSPSPSPFHSEDEVTSVRSGSSRRKQEMPLRSKYKYYRHEGFINYGYWKKVKVCCGNVYYGSNNEILIEASHFKSCCPLKLRESQTNSPRPPEAIESSVGGMSDGGSLYGDESLDNDTYFVPATEETEENTSLLSQLAAALCT